MDVRLVLLFFCRHLLAVEGRNDLVDDCVLNGELALGLLSRTILGARVAFLLAHLGLLYWR